MSTLSIATSGHLPGRTPICLATLGHLCGEVVVIPPEPAPEIPAGGGGRYSPGYTRQRETDLEQTRRRRILQEDEEVVALIMAMITEGLM